MLDPKGEGKVHKAAFLALLSHPDAYVSKPRPRPKPKEAWNEAANDQDKEPEGMARARSRVALSELHRRMVAYAQKEKLDLEKAFRFHDYAHNGLINFETFAKVCQESRLPLDAFELRSVFEALQERGSHTINYAGLLEKLHDIALLHNEVKDDVEEAALDEVSIRNLKFKVTQLAQENAELRKQLHARAKEATGNEAGIETRYAELEEMERKVTALIKDPKQRQIYDLHRKVEMLEGVVRERDTYIRKALTSTGGLELSLMKKNSELEKAELRQVIATKNKEIQSFKNELDTILAEMQKLKRRKPQA
jgi:hypothetical protein